MAKIRCLDMSKKLDHVFIGTNSFCSTSDIRVMSMFDPQKNEVAAFEELVGSHGRLGGDQSEPFVMYYPYERDLDDVQIVGAEEICRVLKQKIASLSLSP